MKVHDSLYSLERPPVHWNPKRGVDQRGLRITTTLTGRPFLMDADRTISFRLGPIIQARVGPIGGNSLPGRSARRNLGPIR